MRKIKSQEEVDDADAADDRPGDDEGEGPVTLYEEAGDDGALRDHVVSIRFFSATLQVFFV